MPQVLKQRIYGCDFTYDGERCQLLWMLRKLVDPRPIERILPSARAVSAEAALDAVFLTRFGIVAAFVGAVAALVVPSVSFIVCLLFGLFDDEVHRFTVARVVLNPELQVEATFNVLYARLAQ